MSLLNNIITFTKNNPDIIAFGIILTAIFRSIKYFPKKSHNFFNKIKSFIERLSSNTSEINIVIYRINIFPLNYLPITAFFAPGLIIGAIDFLNKDIKKNEEAQPAVPKSYVGPFLRAFQASKEAQPAVPTYRSNAVHQVTSLGKFALEVINFVNFSLVAKHATKNLLGRLGKFS